MHRCIKKKYEKIWIIKKKIETFVHEITKRLFGICYCMYFTGSITLFVTAVYTRIFLVTNVN